MGKKKNKKKNISTVNSFDTYLDNRYDKISDEIIHIQKRLDTYDSEALKKSQKIAKDKYKKKQIKSYKNGKKISYKESPEYKKMVLKEYKKICNKNRRDICKDIEATDFLERVYDILVNVKQIAVIISRLVVALICSILSFDCIKSTISKDTLKKLELVKKKALSIN